MFKLIVELDLKDRGLGFQPAFAYVSADSHGQAWERLDAVKDDIYGKGRVTYKASIKMPDGTLLFPTAQTLDVTPKDSVPEIVEYQQPLASLIQ